MKESARLRHAGSGKGWVVAASALVVCGFLGFVLVAAVGKVQVARAERARYLYYPDRLAQGPNEPDRAGEPEATEPAPTSWSVGGGSTSTIPLDIKVYRAKPGDTFSGIANRFGLDLDTIASLNREFGSGVHLVMVGEEIEIPNQDGIFIRLNKNKGLEALSEEYEVPAEVVLQVNDLRQQDVKPGTDLFFPGVQHTGVERSVAIGVAFMRPVAGYVSSGFGYRRDPFAKVHAFHRGMDIAGPAGSTVRAALDGRVLSTGYDRVLGNHIVVAHQIGYTTVYGHLSRILVRTGQTVRRGERIGLTGSTGQSTGPHLHFELRRRGVPINPSRLVLGL